MKLFRHSETAFPAYWKMGFLKRLLLFRLLATVVGFFEGGCPVLEKLFLPPVENRWLQVVFVAQVRDWFPVNKVPFENVNLLLACVIFPLFAHGEFLR
jgi:hypothetical protein